MRTYWAALSGHLHRDDRGATAAEYGLIVVVILTAIATVVALYADQVAELFGQYQIPE
jgi:Flp pilus assembly pilin Flp